MLPVEKEIQPGKLGTAIEIERLALEEWRSKFARKSGKAALPPSRIWNVQNHTRGRFGPSKNSPLRKIMLEKRILKSQPKTALAA
jgi:hypothetical protein